MPHDRLTPLFEKLAGPLRLFARQWLEPAAAEEVVQEAFVRLLGQRQLPDDPAAWLFTVVRRAALDGLRRRRVRHAALPKLVPADMETADPLAAAEAVAALAELPDRQREIVIARHWGDLGFAAIAALLGIAVSTAHSDYTAAIAALRERLDR